MNKMIKFNSIFAIMLLVGCSSFGINKDVGTPESRAVAMHKNLAIKLQDTQGTIDSICHTSTDPFSPEQSLIPDETCRRVRRVFNIVTKGYVIAGNYINIQIDPENRMVYMEIIGRKMFAMLKSGEHDHYLKSIILGIDEIVKAGDIEDPYWKSEKILNITLDRLFPVMTGILQPYIVEEDNK